MSGRSTDYPFWVPAKSGGVTKHILSSGSLSQNIAHDVFKKTGRLR